MVSHNVKFIFKAQCREVNVQFKSGGSLNKPNYVAPCHIKQCFFNLTSINNLICRDRRADESKLLLKRFVLSYSSSDFLAKGNLLSQTSLVLFIFICNIKAFPKFLMFFVGFLFSLISGNRRIESN